MYCVILFCEHLYQGDVIERCYGAFGENLDFGHAYCVLLFSENLDLKYVYRALLKGYLAKTRPKIVKLFSCSTQLSLKFIMLINLKPGLVAQLVGNPTADPGVVSSIVPLP